jgi:hypothetical protein
MAASTAPMANGASGARDSPVQQTVKTRKKAPMNSAVYLRMTFGS